MNYLESNGRIVSIGLYRKYDGKYYFLSNIVSGKETYCIYFDVLKPEEGEYIIELKNWFSEISENGVKIKERVDNVTGQKCMFERIRDIDFQLGDCSTFSLLEELSKRSDSPLNELDLKELHSKIVNRSYVCANVVLDEIINMVAFETKEEAVKYKEKHETIKKPMKIFKRIYLKED